MTRRCLLGIAAFAVLTAAGCKSGSAQAAFKELKLDESVAAHKAGAMFFDANTDDFRKANGKVPGAVLLKSSSQYDVAATLPADKDKQLVFYCTSPT